MLKKSGHPARAERARPEWAEAERAAGGHALGVFGLFFGVVFVTVACTETPFEQPAPRTQEQPTTHQNTGVLTGMAPRATGGFPSVVSFAPRFPNDVPVPPDTAVLDQYNTDFHPRVLVVRAGQTVEFKNSEDTLHNVHVVDTATRETAFNVATPVTGSYDYVFETPSTYDVSCGIHPSMAAIIVVTETPYVTVADVKGAFSIARPPFGDYDVAVWNLDPSRRSQRQVAIDAATESLELDVAEDAS